MFRLVTKTTNEAHLTLPGVKVLRFDRDFILISIGFASGGEVDYMSYGQIAQPPGDPTTPEGFLLLQAKKNPLFMDPLGAIGILTLANGGGIELPVNTEREILIKSPGEVVVTYLEKIY